MWTREYLKTRAKEVLRTAYWPSLLVSVIIAFAGGGRGRGGGGGSGNFNQFSDRNSDFEYFSNSFSDFDIGSILAFISVFVLIFVIVLMIVAAFRIFLGYPLEVGGRRFYVQSAQDPSSSNINLIGFAFKKGIYKDVVKAMLYKGVINLLWYFLLLIPGYVKSYAYMMVPYILADNPNIGHKRALELSNKMTYGHKFSMFVLVLSFIGWFLLGLLACCVGVVFVMPYLDATFAQLYLVLRRNAIDNGLCSYEELMIEESGHDEASEW
ncbi:MAG: DUF975 family protein [Clostridiaceae bacterium]|nr:DUF975 family protein [Clostridiaceae bacterium]